MRRLWCWLVIYPLLIWSNPSDWEARSEEEALFLRRISDFWQEGEYQIAKNQMEEFLTAYPESSFSSPLSAALGDLLLREKEYAAALNYYSKITAPELLDQTFLNRMQCLYYMEWYPTLADACEQFLQKEGIDPEQKLQTTYYLAIALYQQCLNAEKDETTLLKLAERAKPHFQLLFETDLNNEVAAAFAHLSCILKEYEKAASIYLDLAKKESDTREEMLFQAALIQAEYDKPLAIKTFEEIAQLSKSKAKDAAYNRLVLLFEIGEYERIVSEKKSLLSQIPPDRDAMAHLFIGRSLLSLKKYAEATEELKMYLKEAPLDASLRGALVSLLDSSFRANDLESLDLALGTLKTQFPNDPEILSETLKGRFSRALMLKKGHKIEDARQEIEAILSAYPQFSEAPQATFELAHLDYQAKQWQSCREKSIAFLTQFADHPLAPYVWRYQITASLEMTKSAPENRAYKTQLISDLEMLIQQAKDLSLEELSEWRFVLAKTEFEMGAYEEALAILLSLVESQTPFSDEANAHLLIALCYRDGLQETARFCTFGEKAIEKGATLLDLGTLHASLFNGYLDRGMLDTAAKHLFAAFEHQTPLQIENLLWLANYFDTDGELHPESYPKAKALLEDLLKREKDPLFLEPLLCKLGKIYSLLGEKEKALVLLEKLTSDQKENPNLEWQNETESLFLLGRVYASLGDEEKALHLFDAIAEERSQLRNPFGAAASLESAKLRAAKATSQDEKILTQLKNLTIQKTLLNEPLHLQAALEYVDLQTRFEPNQIEKKHLLLTKTKKSFETTEDLLSKDYHEARQHFPLKNQVYEAYMLFIDAQILETESALSKDLDTQKKLQAKAKDLLLQIVNEKAHPDLVARAQKQLAHGSSSEPN